MRAVTYRYPLITDIPKAPANTVWKTTKNTTPTPNPKNTKDHNTMWESKEQAIDVNYNADELWFVGVYGQLVAKPTEIRKWEENTKFFKLAWSDLAI